MPRKAHGSDPKNTRGAKKAATAAKTITTAIPSRSKSFPPSSPSSMASTMAAEYDVGIHWSSIRAMPLKW
jgi:hypothetical protein